MEPRGIRRFVVLRGLVHRTVIFAVTGVVGRAGHAQGCARRRDLRGSSEGDDRPHANGTLHPGTHDGSIRILVAGAKEACGASARGKRLAHSRSRLSSSGAVPPPPLPSRNRPERDRRRRGGPATERDDRCPTAYPIPLSDYRKVSVLLAGPGSPRAAQSSMLSTARCRGRPCASAKAIGYASVSPIGCRKRPPCTGTG